MSEKQRNIHNLWYFHSLYYLSLKKCMYHSKTKWTKQKKMFWSLLIKKIYFNLLKWNERICEEFFDITALREEFFLDKNIIKIINKKKFVSKTKKIQPWSSIHMKNKNKTFDWLMIYINFSFHLIETKKKKEQKRRKLFKRNKKAS